MNILLMAPPWYRLMGASLSHYPPGPTFIAGALEKIGYDSIVWNADYDPKIRSVVGGTNILQTDELTKKHNLYRENLNNLDKAIWKETESKLRLFKPDVLGISAYSATYKACLNVALLAKRLNPDVITILGGVHPSIDPEGVVGEEAVDFAVFGEGEITTQELIRAIDNGENDFSRIRGLAYKSSGKTIVNQRREPAGNLDNIVSVARHKIYQKELCPPSVFHMVYSSRGCPFKCIYCGSFNVWGHKKRSRSAESLLDEIEKTHKDYKTRYFYVCDDIFFHPNDMERAYKFCKGLIERKLNILWSTQTRAETINEDNEEILKLMKKAGGQHISVGVETGSDRISKLIKKNNNVEHSRKAAKLIRKHGLYMACFFMFGFPWETEDEIRETIDSMKEIDPPIAFPHIVTPAPGTELNKIALDMGLITPDFAIENFYHESPEMCLSVEIPQEKKRAIIYKTLKVFAEHNKRHFRRDLIRRWYFYYSLMHDNGIFERPSLLIQYIKDAFSQN